MQSDGDGEAAESFKTCSGLPIRSNTIDPGPESQRQPSDPRSPKSSHSKNSSISGLKAGQSQVKAIPKPQNSDSPSIAAPAQQAMATPLPDFIVERNEFFDKLKRQRHAQILEKEKPEIDVVLDLGLNKDGKPRAAMPVAAKAWESTPGSFLKHVDKDISSDVVVAKVNGKELWDLDRPLEFGCRVSYVPFSSAEGRNVFWHSSAHVLGEAAECQYNCLLSHGPPVEQGFFYDMAIAGGWASPRQT